jgi:uncharacterized membrane protein
MHPFDIRDALFAKHAQHVVIIHFPIALFITGAVFDYLGQFFARPALRSAAEFNFLAAALSAPIAVVTGLLAWRFQLEGQHLRGVLPLHLLLGSASAALIVFVWWTHRQHRNVPVAIRLSLEAAAVAVIGLTGHLGGFLSGVNT